MNDMWRELAWVPVVWGGMWLPGWGWLVGIWALRKNSVRWGVVEGVWALGLGMGWVSLVMILSSILGWHWDGGVVAVCLAPTALIFLGRGGLKLERPKFNLRLDGLVMVAGIVILVRVLVLGGQLLSTRDALGWDGIQSWFFKAKVFYETRGVDAGLLSDKRLDLVTGGVGENYTHPNYPPLVPLVVSFSYILRGQESVFLAKTLWFLVVVLIVAAIYAEGKRRVGKTGAILVAAGVASLPVWVDHAGGKYAGYADLPLAFLMFGAVLAMMREKPFVAVLLASLAALTKLEGATFLVIVLVAMWIRWGKKALWLVVVPVGVMLPWVWFIWSHGLGDGVGVRWGGWEMRNGWEVIKAAVVGGFSWREFLWFWPVVAVTGIVRKRTRWLAVVGLGQLGFCLVGLFARVWGTPAEVAGQAAGTVDRLWFQLVPLAGLWWVYQWEKRKAVA